MTAAIDADAVPRYAEMLSLAGKAYLVLGAGHGMGRQVSHALTQCGAEVMCVDVDPAIAGAVAAEVGATPYSADLTQEAEVQKLFEAASARFGARLAGFVDIVGVAMFKHLRELDEKTWRSSFDLVLHHAYLATRIGSDYLARNGGGAITLVGSISGMLTFRRQAAYGVAKAALHHFVRYAAHELAADHIRVNGVAPGFVKTPSLRGKLDAAMWKRIDDSVPFGRAAIPSDVAAAILFLQSDLARYVTGNVMVLDGAARHSPSIPQI
jgi:NAD(P)-dependent dehydrogenase (short-subunit alcohol dehydrogenase family)